MKDAETIAPPTLKSIAAEGMDVIAFCDAPGCGHIATVSIGTLIDRLGPGLPFPELRARLRCSACGGRNVGAQPDWRAYKAEGKVDRYSARPMSLGDRH